jgi:hypothetical protein
MGDTAAMAAVMGTAMGMAMAAVMGTAMGMAMDTDIMGMGTDMAMAMGTDMGMGMGMDTDTGMETDMGMGMDTDTGIGMAVVAGGTAGGMVTAVPAGCGRLLAGFGLATENGSKGAGIASPLLMAIFAEFMNARTNIGSWCLLFFID